MVRIFEKDGGVYGVRLQDKEEQTLFICPKTPTAVSLNNTKEMVEIKNPFINVSYSVSSVLVTEQDVKPKDKKDLLGMIYDTFNGDDKPSEEEPKKK